MATHATAPRPHRTRRHPDYRRLAILFLCVVSITLLIVSAVVERTSPLLVLIPTAIGALVIARMGR
jgi:fatty acid desaturase